MNKAIKKVSFERELFGDKIEIEVYNAEEFLVEDILKEAYELGKKLQKIFNFYDKDSELSILNKKRSIIASKELLEVIKKGIEYSKITKGKYDITLGKNFLNRKNARDLENIKNSYKDIKINSNKVVLNHPDALIDLGSIAKGYIADKIATFLRSKGVSDFLIDARGDIIVSGDYEYVLGIKHPRKEEDLYKIKIKNKAVATSGDYNQYQEDYTKSHILNANAISVTVISKNLTDADVLATALFVSDTESKEKILKKDKNSAVLIVNKNLKTEKYNKMEEVLI